LPSVSDLCDLHKNTQSQTSISLLFFTVIDQPIQHFTSRIVSLRLFDSQTTVQLQQLSSKTLEKQLHKGREKEKA